MILKIKKRVNSFVMVDKSVVEDNRLSLKARGLMTYLLSRPPDWTIVMNHLLGQFKEGKDSVQSGFSELKKHGYAKLEIQRDESGKIKGKSWTIYEEPVEVATDSPVSHQTVKPSDGKTATNKKDSTKKEKTDRQELSVCPTESMKAEDKSSSSSSAIQSFYLGNKEAQAPRATPKALIISDQVQAILRCHPSKKRATDAIPAIQKAILDSGYDGVLAATNAYAQHVADSGTKEPSWPVYWFEEKQYKLFLPEQEQEALRTEIDLNIPARPPVELPELSDEEIAEQNKQMAQYETKRHEAALN